MTTAQLLQSDIASAEAKEQHTEAILHLRDGSRLCFCHRVGERWAKAVGPQGREDQSGVAGEFLSLITTFRLNAKHLDVQFRDNSRWDEALQRSNAPKL